MGDTFNGMLAAAGLVTSLAALVVAWVALRHSLASQPKRMHFVICEWDHVLSYLPLYVAMHRYLSLATNPFTFTIMLGGASDRRTWASVIERDVPSMTADVAIADPLMVPRFAEQGRAPGVIVGVLLHKVVLWTLFRRPSKGQATASDHKQSILGFQKGTTTYMLVTAARRAMYPQYGQVALNFRLTDAFAKRIMDPDIAFGVAPEPLASDIERRSDVERGPPLVAYASVTECVDPYYTTGIMTRPDIACDRHKQRALTMFLDALKNAIGDIYDDSLRREIYDIAASEFPSSEPTTIKSAVDQLIAARVWPRSLDVQDHVWQRTQAVAKFAGVLRRVYPSHMFVGRKYLRCSPR